VGDRARPADGSPPLEEVVEQVGEGGVGGPFSRVLRRRTGYDPRHTEVGELVDAVFDVQLQPSERLHQRFDVEGLVGA